MEKKIVIQSEANEIKVGIVEDGRLVEFHLEDKQNVPLVGSIYKGRVENILPGMQSAFVDIGLAKNAFLFVQEALPTQADGSEGMKELPPIEAILKEGQELMVQIIKEPNGYKGARISTQITLAGRYLVYLPTSEHIGISRKIERDEDREEMRQIAEKLRRPGEGLIIRTVALGKSEEELGEDLAMLRAKWQQILQAYQEAAPTTPIYYDLNLGERLVRDFVKKEVVEIVVNDHELYQQIKNHLALYCPEQLHTLKWEAGDLFFKHQLYEELETALQTKVWLKNGGYLVLNQTEAMMVIDVNTGKYVGHTCLEDTVKRLNLEAVKEVCRQIRLRNVGGIIIIDFIDMREEEHRKEILDAVIQEAKKDQMKVTVLGLTSLGLVEMTRKKVRHSLANLFTVECSACNGSGYVKKSAPREDG